VRLGERVRETRRKRVLSQPELAQRAGLTVTTLNGIETGRVSRPRPRTIRALASALEVRADWLVFGSDFRI